MFLYFTQLDCTFCKSSLKALSLPETSTLNWIPQTAGTIVGLLIIDHHRPFEMLPEFPEISQPLQHIFLCQLRHGDDEGDDDDGS